MLLVSSATCTYRATLFSTGPMNCIEKSVAYLATKLAVAHLLWRYDSRLHGEVLLVAARRDWKRFGGLGQSIGMVLDYWVSRRTRCGL
jgi:hypothetical protein